MSFTAIVATLDEESDTPVRGNGKSNVMVFFAIMEWRKKRRKIVANLHLTNIPFTYLPAIEIYNYFITSQLKDTLILLDEMPEFLNSLGQKSEEVNSFTNKFIGQVRKFDNDAITTAQRFMDIPKKMRAQVDKILIPLKIHEDDSVCYKDNCKEHHWIEVYSYKPFLQDCIEIIDAWKVGQYYDTNEIITDSLKGINKDRNVFA